MTYNVITIEREYASGGREIGQLVAEKLGVPYYADEILHIAAKRIGLPPEYVERQDETAPNSLLYSLSIMGQTISYGAKGSAKADALQTEEVSVIRELADKGHCVIIGRCAGAVLKERANVLRVFVYANPIARRERAVEVYGVDAKQADTLLKKHDKNRANYYNFYSDQKWDNKAGYHLMLDSGKLGIERCVAIIAGIAG